MFRWLRADVLIPLILIIGVAQYAGVALNLASQGDVALWQVDSSALEGAGFSRYLKDGFLLFMSVVWPIRMLQVTHTRDIATVLGGYGLWIMSTVIVGLVGIMVGFSPSFFMTAGLRWVMLLHVSVGIFFIMKSFPSLIDKQRTTLRWVSLLALLDLALIMWQLRAGIAAFGVGIGQSRLTGFFSNAGVAGFFGLALALVGLIFDGTSLKARLGLSSIALLITLSSGSRSMMMAVFLIIAVQIFELAESSKNRRARELLKFSLVPILILTMWIGYQEMISVVNRGGILEAQLSGGGRISNFVNMIEVISRSDTGEFLFGRGLGLATNTAYGMLQSAGIPPEIYRFNWAIDNAFMTQFFQFGLLGSIVFWGGILVFIVCMRPRVNRRYKRRYWIVSTVFFLILWAGNPFEQYFLMMPFAIALGATYWSSRALQTGQVRTGPRENV